MNPQLIEFREEWMNAGYMPEMLILTEDYRLRFWDWDRWEKKWHLLLDTHEYEWSFGNVLMTVLDLVRPEKDKVDTKEGGILVIYSRDCCYWLEQVGKIARGGKR